MDVSEDTQLGGEVSNMGAKILHQAVWEMARMNKTEKRLWSGGFQQGQYTNVGEREKNEESKAWKKNVSK